MKADIGDHRFKAVTLCLCSGPNDGTVAVEETKLTSGLKVDTRMLHLPHTTIATSPLVAPLVIQFLRYGAFLE